MAEKYIKLSDLQRFPIRADHYDMEHGDEHFINGIETVMEYAEHLASDGWIPVTERTPERKKGHWQIYIISMLDGEGCKCSECGHEGVPYWDFCPNCGTEMDGEQDG